MTGNNIIELKRDSGACLQVDCDIDTGTPACLTGHPDDWSPSEPAEVSVYSVVLERNNKIRKLPKKILDKLQVSEDFASEILEKMR